MSANSFTRTVVSEMQRLYPEFYADRAWDNVGLLLENTELPRGSVARDRVLLTNDLTPDVVDEAIEYNVSVIVAYHPIIFRGLKSLTLKDSQQTSLLRLMQHNIAVYSPHTALDAAEGGINAWLADKVARAARDLDCQSTQEKVIKEVTGPVPPAYEAAVREARVGYGRRVGLQRSVNAYALIQKFVAQMGGQQRHVLVARPRWSQLEYGGPLEQVADDTVFGVAVCAGSGFDVIKDCSNVNMFITGEVSHHDALQATTRGIWVVCLLHSNSERLFLAERLRGQLQTALDGVPGLNQPAVLVSERDRDPFAFWDISQPPPKSGTGVDTSGTFSV